MKSFFKFLLLILVIANILVLFVFDRFIPSSISLPFMSVEGLANVLEDLSEQRASEEEAEKEEEEKKDLEAEEEKEGEAAEGEEDADLQTGREEPAEETAEETEAEEPAETEEPAEAVPACRVISDTGSNVRSGAGIGFSVIGAYPYNAVLTITGEKENGWYPVMAQDGTEGYIFESQVEIIDAGAEGEGPAEGLMQ